MNEWLTAVILGVVEGLTEFLPVSSTAHLLLAGKLLGAVGVKWDAFTVLIQLGAILAVVVLYFERLWTVAITLNTKESRRFVLTVLVAFLPAGVIGAIVHHKLADIFQNTALICWALLIGGIVLLVIDRVAPKPTHFNAMRYPLLTALGIGMFQCLAVIPGASRSGSSIVGAMLLKVEKKSAAEFSFFLAIPTMLGAFVLDLAKQHKDIAAAHAWGLIAVGFVVSFVVALFVIRGFIGFVGKHGFGAFAWWRIAVGAAGLIAVSRGW